MNWYKIFYWLTVSDNVKMTFAIAAFVSGLFFVGMTMGAFGIFDNSVYEKWSSFTKRMYKLFMVSFLITGTLWVFTPSKTDCLLIIAGGSVGNFISTDSSAQAIPSDITRFLHLQLQSQIAGAGNDMKRQLNMQSPKEKLMDKVVDMTKEQIIELMKTDTTISVK